jgi:hypothetical protein
LVRWTPLPGYSSRFSFLFPQCVSLRSGLNTRSTFRLSALHADPRMHQRPAIFRGHDQRLGCGSLFLKVLLSLRKFQDEIRGVLECHKLAPARQVDRIFERSFPALRLLRQIIQRPLE